MVTRPEVLSGQPAASAEVPERADAARNRTRVLAAAADLFATRDPRTVTMDDIAKAAGVGRATVYRRYPDTWSIAVALLDEHERTLQERLLRGDPPLGPGAPSAIRLAAFYAAMIELLEAHADLVLGTETGRARFATGAYGFWSAPRPLTSRRRSYFRSRRTGRHSAGTGFRRGLLTSARPRPDVGADHRRAVTRRPSGAQQRRVGRLIRQAIP